jgi:mono/diheme cytochrome c family protein
MKMPRNQFSDSQTDALVTALLAQTARAQSLPARLRIPVALKSSYQPAGRAGQLMNDLHCLSCHSINGAGGNMAPDLSWEGTAVQRTWLIEFLKSPNTLRPTLIRRMPRFNLTNDEANTLADYIGTAYQTPAFDGDEIDASRFTAADIARGKDLYYGKYACDSCHILNPDRDKGYIGPTLTQVGQRLNAAWIFHWLKNAQALRPGTLELNWNMNDDDARAITAFLMQQKGARR